jgi:hypothetical protein
MARVTEVRWIDNLTGEQIEPGAVQTLYLQVGQRGRTYKLDVSGETYSQTIEPLITCGELVSTKGGGSMQPDNKPTRTDPAQNRAMRIWWEQNQGRASVPKFQPRGRIPSDVSDMYTECGGLPVPVPLPPDEPTTPAPRKRTSPPKVAARKRGTRTA